MPRQRRSREEWQRLIGDLGSSGLTPPQFAAERGLHPKTLAYWIYRLRRDAVPGADRDKWAIPQFLPVSLRCTPARPMKSSTQVLPAGNAGVIEAWFREDLRVRFATTVDCDYLGRLFAAMARHAEC